MRNLLFVAIIALSLAQIACEKGGPVKTKGGNTVTIHTNNSGPKVTYGQTVLINVNTWLNDSLIQSTMRDNGGPREVAIPDSSQMKAKVPAVFEALLMMANGDSATVIQPVDSIMARGIPKEFGDVKTIRYEVKVVDILTPEKIAAREAEEMQKMEGVKAQGVEVAATVATTLADYKAKKLGDKLQKTASGLEYVIIEQGTGAPIKDGDNVPTNYYGVLKANGTMFDNSFDRGGAAPFQVGALVPGFNEGMKLLNKGGKAILFIPFSLAYGEAENGPIPAKSDLVFYIGLE
jgi:FKBP-type peptidyl-prolyl cis-trans isomerase FkpA